MSDVLHHETVKPRDRTPDRWIAFLHGIFGAGRNWRSVARRLTDRRPDWGGILVDLRLHGASPDPPPPHTLAACARDLESLFGGPAPAPTAVLGHSFGGKVALTYGRDAPDRLRELWIVDATPSAREPGGDAWRMLGTLRELPGPFHDRDEVVTALAERGFPRSVGRWMATNLREEGGDLVWRLDPDALEELLRDAFEADLWPVIASLPDGLSARFVKAEGSDILPEEECDRIEATPGRVALHRLDGGHWLNVSNPDGLLRLLEEGLPS